MKNSQPEDNFDIDGRRLDYELERHSSLFGKYANMLPDAMLTRDEAESDLELCKAELDKEIRSNPEKFKLDKVTEPAIKTVMILQDDYQKADYRVIKAKHKVRIIEAILNRLDHRKMALGKLVDLELKDYHSAVKVSNQHSDEDIQNFRDKRKSQEWNKVPGIKKGGKK